jgi:hypothetical protein
LRVCFIRRNHFRVEAEFADENSAEFDNSCRLPSAAAQHQTASDIGRRQKGVTTAVSRFVAAKDRMLTH